MRANPDVETEAYRCQCDFDLLDLIFSPIITKDGQEDWDRAPQEAMSCFVISSSEHRALERARDHLADSIRLLIEKIDCK